jgi:hypothetical protein
MGADMVTRLRIGDVALTRVPYFDVPLAPGAVGLTADDVAEVSWAPPTWATADGEVLVGQAVWVAESDGRTAVIDPCGAADEFLRAGDAALMHQERVRAAMADAGIPAERVDVVVLTHLDGIGMAAAVRDNGDWEPMFPNARIVMTQAELDWLANGHEVMGIGPLQALIAHGAVDGVGARHDLTTHLRLEQTGGHTPGHAIICASGVDGSRAVFIGHLAVSPLHLTVAPGPASHVDSNRARRVLHDLVEDAHADGALLIGSLWPSPGAATVGEARDARPIVRS